MGLLIELYGIETANGVQQSGTIMALLIELYGIETRLQAAESGHRPLLIELYGIETFIPSRRQVLQDSF